MSSSCSNIGTSITPPGFGSDNPPDMSLKEPSEVPPKTDTVIKDKLEPISDWIASPCNEAAKYRFLSSGHVEVFGRGVPKSELWPVGMEGWEELINDAASVNGISPALLAAMVAAVSEGNAALVRDGRYGLLQLDLELARLVSGASKASTETVIHPSWNLMFGAKYIANCLNDTENNLVGAITLFRQGAVKCNVSCELDSYWGTYTECGFVSKVIALMNLAIDNGYEGVMFVDLGGEGSEPDREGSNAWFGFAALGLIAAGVYGFTRLGAKNVKK